MKTEVVLKFCKKNLWYSYEIKCLMKTEVVLKYACIPQNSNFGMFNENRSCIEINIVILLEYIYVV